jgi:hydroxymethylpyrimidine pyrophosphatase-like HAD family hydrolase
MNQRNTPKHDPAFVFDLDGVITWPHTTTIDAEALGYVYKLLEQGAYVATNTGRSYEWVEKNVLSALEEMAGTSAKGDLFDKLFIVCEKGGESIKRVDGRFVPQPSRFALPKKASEITRRVYDENQAQLSSMFWDDTKRTMASLEKYPTADIAQFAQEKEFVASKLQPALAGQEAKIDPTVAAIDVEHPTAGKHAGAELIFEWIMSHKGAAHNNFVCFGDSRSDYEMARYFAQQGVHITFIFVGDKGITFEEEPDVTLIRTEASFADGTREYFRNAP